MNRPALSRIATATAWVAASMLAIALAVQRYLAATAGEVGIDLGIWLDATQLARGGGDLYDAAGYTYTPLMAWLLLPLADREQAMAVWTAVSILSGLAAIAFVVAAHRRLLPGWRAPLVAAVAAVTLLYSHVLATELFWGQAQLQVVALLAFAALVATRWPAVAGVAIALVALLKTWPAVIGVWLLRAGARHRLRSVLAAIATVVVFALVMVLVLGPQSIGTLIARTFGFGEQPWRVYSVWYFARHWPPSEATPVAFSDAHLFGQAITVTLVLGVLALIALAVFRPGTPSLALWNIAAATTLLIPVSHSFYRLLVLPLLWVWLAEMLGRRPRMRAAIAVAALSLWWVVGFRWLETSVGGGWPQFVVVAATIAVVALSTLLASFQSARSVPLWQTNRPVAAVSGSEGDPVVSQRG